MASPPIITFTLAGKGGHLDSKALVESLGDALDILQAVDESVSGVEGGSISWELVKATTNSPLLIAFQPITKKAADFSRQVIRHYIDGFKAIESGDRTPQNFNEIALKKAKHLSEQFDNGLGKITIASGRKKYSPTHRLQTNLNKILEPSVALTPLEIQLREHTEFGEIDGYNSTITDHTQLYFNLYDSLTKECIKCVYDESLIEVVRQSWRKNIVVTGDIRYGGDGKAKHIKVRHIRIKRDRTELPQFKTVAIDITGGIESSAYVRGLRDDD
jgi:hypothetical protein